ncbi:hypothetical protein CsSME_00009355 [Camellia sinensis var. sinensis]
MGVMMLKNISLFFLIISSSLLSTSFAVIYANQKLQTRTTATVIIIHKRLLIANTKDYGNYDPVPALVKPPFKLIPH